MRVLGVDPGEKRLGIALSDPNNTIASPLMVLKHVSRDKNAARILEIARENECDRIVVGHALSAEGEETFASRRGRRLAGAIRAQLTEGENRVVLLHDEHGTTKRAQQIRREMGVTRAKRSGHLDSLAAAIILQSYLDETTPPHTHE